MSLNRFGLTEHDPPDTAGRAMNTLPWAGETVLRSQALQTWSVSMHVKPRRSKSSRTPI